MATGHGRAEADGGRPARRAPFWHVVGPFEVLLISAFAFQPFMSFLAANGSQVGDVPRVVLYATLTASLGLIVLVIVVGLRRDLSRQRVAVAIAMAIVSFFSFSLLMGQGRQAREEVAQAALWLVLTSALVALGYGLARYEVFRRAVLVFAVVYVAIPSATYLTGRGSAQALDLPGDIATDVGALEGDTPNVYWFVLDEYARSDQLEAILDYDNQAFSRDLRSLGFTVSGSSMANYPRTHLSVSSTLQMDYVAEPENGIEDEFAMMAPILKGENNTVRRFRALGYDFVYSDYGSYQWLACNEEVADVCLPAIEPPRSTDELDQALLKLTPLRLLDIFGIPFTEPRQVLHELDEHDAEFDEPFFLFAHIASPHWPYQYDDSSCEPRDIPRDAYQLDPAERERAYVQDLECVNRSMVETAREIVEADPDAVIIIQSDHGSTFLIDWSWPIESWSDASLAERYSVLNAMRLPEGCGTDAVEGLGLVNTFRLVFSCIEGTDPEFVPSRQFLSPYDQIDEVQEIPPERFDEPDG